MLNYFSPEDLIHLTSFILESKPQNQKVENNWEILLKYYKIFGFDEKLCFNTCLARDIDYYNGFIFEVKINGLYNTVIVGVDMME